MIDEFPFQDAMLLSPNKNSVNHLGSTAFVTDANATITQGFLYAPFGEIISEYQGIAPTSALPKYAFNAKELDEESGMYYYEARYYNPPVFTSRDAMFEQKPWLSPYHYCSNNPVGRVDPSGMMDSDYIDLDGNYLGNDGVYDGKVYVVTSALECKAIARNEADGKTTPLSEVTSAIDLVVPQEIRAQIVDGIMDRECDDQYREYGGIVRDLAVLGSSGYDVDWGIGSERWFGQESIGFDYNTCRGMGTPIVFFHSHESGELGTKKCIPIQQSPTPADFSNANNYLRSRALNVQISTHENKANIFNPEGYVSLPLEVFRNANNTHTPKQ